MKQHIISKRVGALALCAVLAAGTMALPASARGTDVTAQLSPDISIVVDGSYRTFYNVRGEEVHPIVYNGTTYLPIRAIGELMGKNVNWDQSTLTVSIGGKRTTGAVDGTPDRNAKTQKIGVELRPDITIEVDGEARTFKDANGKTVWPMLYDGSVYLPLRAIGSMMGKDVSWDGDEQKVTLEGDSLVTDADSFHDSGSTAGTGATEDLIGSAEAKRLALAHAGLKESQVTFVQTELDWDDGRRVYDVEFYAEGGKEYDYEIDAKTGKVLSYDYDAEGYTPEQGNGSYIGEAKAKQIALGQVSGAKAEHVRKLDFDLDDGRAEYDVEIVYGGVEYEFEIDAVTGKILSKDVDREDD